MESITLALRGKELHVTPHIFSTISSLESCSDTDGCQTGATCQFKAPREYLKADCQAKTSKGDPISCTTSSDRRASMMLTASPLRYDWKKVFYIDGSCQETESSGTCTGAAVYYASDNTAVLIHTGGNDVNNTITRAELSVILVALTGERKSNPSHTELTILTNGLTSLHRTRKAMLSPRQITEHKHKALLDAIMTTLIQRSDAKLSTHIGKVRAYIGKRGPIMGDIGANQSCHARCGNNAMHAAHIEVGSDPYDTRY